MREALDHLTEGYSAALEEYLASGSEAALRGAYELGRTALGDGLGVLDLLAAYQEAVLALIQEPANPGSPDGLRTRAMSFLAESLSPFEMVLRGFLDANARLRRSLQDVRTAQENVRNQYQKLTAAHRQVEIERRRYRELFDATVDPYLITDLDGRILDANQAASALLGSRRESLPGQPLAAFVAEHDREALHRKIDLLKQNGSPCDEEWQTDVLPRDKSPVPAALTVCVETDMAGQPEQLRWRVRELIKLEKPAAVNPQLLTGDADLDAPRRFELLARASSLLESSLDCDTNLAGVARLAADYAADGCVIYLFDKDGAVHQIQGALHEGAAESAHRAFLLPRTRRRSDWLHNLDGTHVLDPIPEACLKGLVSGEAELEALRRLAFQSAIVVPLAVCGRTHGALALLHLPSERKRSTADLSLAEDLARRCALAVENARLYHEIREEKERAEKDSRAKDEFLAILSHELRNPLTPVVGWARILKSQKCFAHDAILSEGINSLERNAEHLARLVDDCLDMARISQGKIHMQRQALDLNQFILSSTAAVREVMMDKRLDLAVELAEGPLWVSGDATRLLQVVNNLLGNAIKFTDAGGQVSVRSIRRDGHVELEVRDTGIGIDPVLLEEIFHPFLQGSDRPTDSGLGLGLALARSIVELHEGRIWAESEGRGCGSTVRVRLPEHETPPELAAGERAARAEALQNGLIPAARLSSGFEPTSLGRIDARAGAGVSSSLPSAAAAAPVPSPIRVLLIEDAKDIQFLMQFELHNLGCDVATASNGLQGFEMARALCPDLIISDIKMPSMDGYTLIRRIRETPELAGIPAIALTGYCMQPDVEKALQAGFSACLPKPCDPDELSRLIRELNDHADMSCTPSKDSYEGGPTKR